MVAFQSVDTFHLRLDGSCMRPESKNTVRLDNLKGGAATSGWARCAWLVANQYVLPVAIPSTVRGHLECILWSMTTTYRAQWTLAAESFCSFCSLIS
jgi:hypothetical protein